VAAAGRALAVVTGMLVAQPFWLRWRDVAGRSRRHAPDLFARLADGSGVVIDVRPDDRIEDKDAEAFDVTKDACGPAGWGFRRVGVPDPVLAANVAWLARYRHPRCGGSPGLARLLQEIFAEPAPLMAGAAAAGDPMAVLPALFHLMWRHALAADLGGQADRGGPRRRRRGSGRCPVTGRPGELGIGDRVRFGGRDQVVIGVSGPVVRLAGTGGEVVTVSVCGLLADGGFAVLDSRPRPGMPQVSVLDGLPAEAVDEARWWERHIAEVLTGVPPDASEGTIPRPEYDPAVVTLTRREQAKAAELTAAGHPVTASAVAKRRRRYQERGLSGMVDYRARRRMPPHGRADAVVVAAMRQAIGEAAEDSTRTPSFVFRRAREILAGADDGERGKLPSERTLYRLFGRLEAGRHTTGSASTRRSLAARPEGPFGQVPAAAPGDVMQIDSTPLDVLVRLDSGVPDRVDLTGIIDVATRTVTAAVLRPTTKSVDASVLLARTVTPEPMRPGWPQAMRMAASALPFRRMLSIDERPEHAAARPVIIPQVIVVDHGKVLVSESFKASCAFLGISFQPARKATGTDKPHIERMMGSVATMFAQYMSGYTGRSPEYRGRGAEKNAVWSLPELQDLLDQWLIAEWQNRPHDGLRDPLHPGRAFSPNEKYAALIETAGYVPLAA
jgi:putative transposase